MVRLSGLYHATRGAHMYFLKSPELKSGADGLVNLVHYEDAASAVAAALVAQLGRDRGWRVFLATDGVPISRRDMVQACLDSGTFEGAMPAFAEEDDSLGKRMSNQRTRQRLGWEPAYASFADFCARGRPIPSRTKRKSSYDPMKYQSGNFVTQHRTFPYD